MRFTVRDYRSADFDTLWAIDQSCFDPEIAYGQDELRFYLRRPGSFTLVAELTDQISDGTGLAILAFLVGESSRRGMGHIITIDVRAQVRRHHIGSALLDAAEERLRAAKCHAVRLETAVDNTSALSFYKRHGYDVIKIIPHYYSNGLDALLLEKNLLPVPASS